jgi:hypothetical protein
MKKITLIVALFTFFLSNGFSQDLVLTAVFDGPLSGGTPKGVELYAINDIADLSVYGLGSANNGGGSDGEEFTFPADAATAGDYIYVASEIPQFTAFFGFAPDYNGGSAMSINGDDAVELFQNGSVVDVFGDIDTDGSGEDWEYADGWAYRNASTGPDGSTFVIASWSFSGPNALDGETSNATAANPVPIGTYTAGPPPSVAAPVFAPAAGTYLVAQDVSMTTTTAGASIYYTTDGTDPDNTSSLYASPVNIATTTTLKAVSYDGSNYSSITTGVYTIETIVQVADIASLRAQNDDNTTIYQLTGEALLSYQQAFRNKKYIQDATAGVEIDDAPAGSFNPGNITTSYEIGDGITGITGRLNTFNGMLQFVPVADPGPASSTGNTITPMVISANDFNANFENYEAMLVRVDNLTFADAGDNFATGTVYPTTDQLGNNVDFRTSFFDADYIGTAIPSGPQKVAGIVTENSGTPYLTSRESSDITPYAPVVPLGSGGIIIAGILIAAIIVIRKTVLI